MRKMKHLFKANGRASQLVAVVYCLFFANQGFSMESDQFLSDNEYEHFMERAQKLKPVAYEMLKKCEAETGKRCLQKGEDWSEVKNARKKNQGYPIIFIDPNIKNYPERIKENLLANLFDVYIAKHVLKIIKSLFPKLYEDIREVDYEGVNHIVTHYGDGISVTPSRVDGLPLFNINVKFAYLSNKEQRCVLAHELGHYVVGHLFENRKYVHKNLDNQKLIQNFKKRENFGGNLVFEPTFKHALSRQNENEADRFAALHAGCSIDDMIFVSRKWSFDEFKDQTRGWLNYIQKKQNLSDLEKRDWFFDPEKRRAWVRKQTFKYTHPPFAARIQYLDQELRHEVKWRKEQNMQPKPIDWKELAAHYLKLIEADSQKKEL